MNTFKPGTLHDGICFDHAVATIYGDGEGPDIDVEIDSDGPQAL
jgi:hypothetical protein